MGIDTSWVQFAAPTRLLFESEALNRCGRYIAAFGKRALIITVKSENQNSEQLAILENSIKKTMEGSVVYEDIQSEANSEQIDTATFFAKSSYVDVIVAYGGLETLNAAKAVALLVNNPIFCEDLFEKKADIKNPALPIISIPAEFTLGEELMPDMTLTNAATGDLHYYYDASMFPTACFYDIRALNPMREEVVARAGAAMLAYCIENILSTKSHLIGQTLLFKAIEMIRLYLPELVKAPANDKLLAQFLHVSSLIGVSSAVNSFGVTYALAKALKVVPTVDYNLALGILLPHVMEYYLTVAPSSFLTIARCLGEDTKDISLIEAAIKAVEGVRRLFSEINLPTRLIDFDIKKHQLGEFAKTAYGYPQIQNSLRKLNPHELESILLAAF